MMKNILIVFALAAFFAACDPVEYDTFSSITGTVVDKGDQSPIDGVSVTLSPSGKSITTDNNGYFQFLDLDAMTYTVTLYKSGYNANRRDITAHAGETENVVITMEKVQ